MMNVTASRPPDPAMEGPLRAEDLAHYERTGWLLARTFFGADEARAISAWTDALLNMPEVPGAQMVYREESLLGGQRRMVQRIENFCPYHPAFDRLVSGGRLEAAVAQLLGAPAVLFKEKINFKMPGGSGFEPHQDQQAGWSVYAPLFVTALVSIERATTANGCLKIADAPRFAGLIGEEWRPLTAGQMASFALVPVPTEPGDVLFFDSYVPHASGPNLTAEARRILYLTYNRATDGNHRLRYFADKRTSFPPNIERMPGVEYRFRV